MAQQDQSDVSIVPLITKVAVVAGGISLVRDAWRHRRLLFVLGAVGGTAALIAKSLDEPHALGRARKIRSKDIGSPSFPGEHPRPATQVPQDEVDEASMESFPASDPPPSYRRA